jgi:DNA polymerase-2
MKARGFILQATYRTLEGRPVVHLHGKLDAGISFLVRGTGEAPHFFVREKDAERARALGAVVIPTTRRALVTHERVSRIEVTAPSDAPPLRDRLRDSGIVCYEADVRFASRFLIARGIKASCTIEGEPTWGARGGLVFDDPRLEPCRFAPELSVLSFDIETDPMAKKLLAVALHGCGTSEVLLLNEPGQVCPEGAIPCGSIVDLLRTFVHRVRELDPDVLTGWNVVDFDLRVLVRLAKKFGVDLDLGRVPGEVRLLEPRSRREALRAQVPGRVVLDGIHLLRGSFVSLESYALDFAAREILGVGKTITRRDRGAEILRLFHEDRPAFVEYTRTDARLVIEILEKKKLVSLAVERSLLTGLTPDRVTGSIAAFDFLYLTELERRGEVAPTVGDSGSEAAMTLGGHVLEPVPGLYRNVLALDFKSLYPSLIRTFQIDPAGYLPAPGKDDDPIVAPDGAAFARGKGILTGILDELFPRREQAKKEKDAVASQAIKILMNSFYGVLGTPVCRFHNPCLANAITGFGREILLWTKRRIESLGYRVLYGDTDSLFVLTGIEDVEEAHRLGAELARSLDADIAEWIQERWRVESRLELELERLYLRFVLFETRTGGAGARKRYAGLVEEGGEKLVRLTGMEAVRRDWTDLARNLQRELYRRLFLDLGVEDLVLSVVEDLRKGILDEHLVYRKALRKPVDAYTATTPPHVAAARKMTEAPGRLISYVMTRNGPEPAEERQSPLDHEHYVQKQIRPVAEPVLALLGLRFEDVASRQRQMRLF